MRIDIHIHIHIHIYIHTHIHINIRIHTHIHIHIHIGITLLFHSFDFARALTYQSKYVLEVCQDIDVSIRAVTCSRVAQGSHFRFWRSKCFRLCLFGGGIRLSHLLVRTLHGASIFVDSLLAKMSIYVTYSRILRSYL